LFDPRLVTILLFYQKPDDLLSVTTMDTTGIKMELERLLWLENLKSERGLSPIRCGCAVPPASDYGATRRTCCELGLLAFASWGKSGKRKCYPVK
jgi:hypothetical protein